MCKHVTARVKMTPAAEPPGGASGSLSGGEPPKPVCKEAPGQEGRLGSLENFLIQERPSHGTFWTISKGEGAQKGGKWGVIDSKYRLICEPKYNTLTQLANGLSKVSIVISQTYDRKNELFGILDQFGQEKLEPIYQFIGDVNDNRISKGRAIINFRGRLGLVD